MSVKPTLDRVLVKPDPKSEMTPGGIYIPNTQEDNEPQMGRIIEVGPGAKDAPMVRITGERVLFAKFSGIQINVDGEDLIIMKESDVLAVLN